MPRRITLDTILTALRRIGREHSALFPLSALLLAGIIASCSTPQQTTSPPSRPTLPDNLLPRRTDLTVTPMTGLNSVRDDFGLTMPLDTTLAFFTSNRNGSRGLHSIFWSRRSEDGWRTPELAVEINNDKSNGVPSITPCGEIMYFAGCDYGFGDCDLYEVASGVRGRVDAETVAWTVPRNLGLLVNSPYWDSQPGVAADGSMLVFSSDRPGGFGGRDIWISLRNQDGTWGRPLNAGSQVNTIYDEVTPSLTPDCRTLFFSSNGQPGMGGFDLFSVEIDPEAGLDIVGPATNLGQPINSRTDEIGLTVSSGGTEAFFSSNRSGGLGGYDIYRLSPIPVNIEPLAIVRGVVADENGKPIFAQIRISNLSSGNVIGTAQTNPESGTYEIVLRRGGDYAVTALATDRLFHSRQIVVPSDLTAETEYRLNHTLHPAIGETPLLLFFTPGSVTLERESIVDLDYVVTFLKSHPTLRVEIAGHTDNIGKPEENRTISMERARAVKSYLVGNRIQGDRVDVKGYGDTQPIADNRTEEGRRANRRVEMRVLEARAE